MVIQDKQLYKSIKMNLDVIESTKDTGKQTVDYIVEERPGISDEADELLGQHTDDIKTVTTSTEISKGEHLRKKKRGWKSWIPRLCKRKPNKNENFQGTNIEIEDTMESKV